MKHINMGSVSTATMREEDLIPTFLYELRNQSPCHREHLTLIREIESRASKDGYYASEDAGYNLESLFDALGEYCAPFFYFGAHPGDSSDYGYWLSESWEESLEEDGGIKVSDTADVPRDHVGYVAVVNDHGNVTLYRRGRNHRLYEIWSVV